MGDIVSTVINMWDDDYATKNRPGSVPVCSSLQGVFIVVMKGGGGGYILAM